MADPIVPTVLTTTGAVPRSPTEIYNTLITGATALSPGLTANLPGSLLDDVTGTEVAGIAQCDAAWVELLNSLTPVGANAFLLNMMGQFLGVPIGTAQNTSVNVVFSGPSGLVIPRGFVVSDGTHQYVTQDDAIISGSGSSQPIFAVALVSGIWAVPANTVTTRITSNGSLTGVNNPTAGTPGTDAQTESSYRAALLSAGQGVVVGTPQTIRKSLLAVPGVQSRLVLITPATNIAGVVTSGFKAIVGGGDSVAVGGALWIATIDPTMYVGSALGATAITNANPAAVTTNINHGYTTGQVVTLTGASPAAFNVSVAITVVDQKHFTLNGVNSGAFGAYVANSATISPNLRNITVTIKDPITSPYTITFVNPPQQTVAVTLTWNTSFVGFTNQATVNSLGNAALVSYINGISVGQPINVFNMEDAFTTAIASVLDPTLVTRMVFSVSINGIVTAPTAGTGTIFGDPESYFFTTTPSVTVAQG